MVDAIPYVLVAAVVVTLFLLFGSKAKTTGARLWSKLDWRKKDKDKKKSAFSVSFLVAAIASAVACIVLYKSVYTETDNELVRFWTRPVLLILITAFLFFVSEMFGFTKITPVLRNTFAIVAAGIILVTIFTSGQLGLHAAEAAIDKVPTWSKDKMAACENNCWVLVWRSKEDNDGNVYLSDGATLDRNEFVVDTIFHLSVKRPKFYEYKPGAALYVVSIDEHRVPTYNGILVKGFMPFEIKDGSSNTDDGRVPPMDGTRIVGYYVPERWHGTCK